MGGNCLTIFLATTWIEGSWCLWNTTRMIRPYLVTRRQCWFIHAELAEFYYISCFDLLAVSQNHSRHAVAIVINPKKRVLYLFIASSCLRASLYPEPRGNKCWDDTKVTRRRWLDGYNHSRKFIMEVDRGLIVGCSRWSEETSNAEEQEHELWQSHIQENNRRQIRVTAAWVSAFPNWTVGKHQASQQSCRYIFKENNYKWPVTFTDSADGV